MFRPDSSQQAHLHTLAGQGRDTAPSQGHGIRPARGRSGSWPSGVYPGSVASPGFVCHSKEYGTRQQTGTRNSGLSKSLLRVSGELGGPHAYSPPALTWASHGSLAAAIPRRHSRGTPAHPGEPGALFLPSPRALPRRPPHAGCSSQRSAKLIKTTFPICPVWSFF